jgi:hypothetical protein
MNNNPYKVVTATYAYFGYKVFAYAKTTYCTALGFVEILQNQKKSWLEDVFTCDHRKTAFIYDCFAEFFVKHYPFQLDLFESNKDFKKHFNTNYANFDDLHFDKNEYKMAFLWETFLEKHLDYLTDIEGHHTWFVKDVIHLASSNFDADLTKMKKWMTTRIKNYLNDYQRYYLPNNE